MNDPDSAGDWPIHALTADKKAEWAASIALAWQWHRDYATAMGDAGKWLAQAQRGETPHD